MESNSLNIIYSFSQKYKKEIKNNKKDLNNKKLTKTNNEFEEQILKHIFKDQITKYENYDKNKYKCKLAYNDQIQNRYTKSGNCQVINESKQQDLSKSLLDLYKFCKQDISGKQLLTLKSEDEKENQNLIEQLRRKYNSRNSQLGQLTKEKIGDKNMSFQQQVVVLVLEEYTEKSPKDQTNNVYGIAKQLTEQWANLENDQMYGLVQKLHFKSLDINNITKYNSHIYSNKNSDIEELDTSNEKIEQNLDINQIKNNIENFNFNKSKYRLDIIEALKNNTLNEVIDTTNETNMNLQDDKLFESNKNQNDLTNDYKSSLKENNDNTTEIKSENISLTYQTNKNEVELDTKDKQEEKYKFAKYFETEPYSENQIIEKSENLKEIEFNDLVCNIISGENLNEGNKQLHFIDPHSESVSHETNDKTNDIIQITQDDLINDEVSHSNQNEVKFKEEKDIGIQMNNETMDIQSNKKTIKSSCQLIDEKQIKSIDLTNKSSLKQINFIYNKDINKQFLTISMSKNTDNKSYSKFNKQCSFTNEHDFANYMLKAIIIAQKQLVRNKMTQISKSSFFGTIMQLKKKYLNSKTSNINIKVKTNKSKREVLNYQKKLYHLNEHKMPKEKEERQKIANKVVSHKNGIEDDSTVVNQRRSITDEEIAIEDFSQTWNELEAADKALSEEQQKNIREVVNVTEDTRDIDQNEKLERVERLSNLFPQKSAQEKTKANSSQELSLTKEKDLDSTALSQSNSNQHDEKPKNREQTKQENKNYEVSTDILDSYSDKKFSRNDIGTYFCQTCNITIRYKYYLKKHQETKNHIFQSAKADQVSQNSDQISQERSEVPPHQYSSQLDGVFKADQGQREWRRRCPPNQSVQIQELMNYPSNDICDYDQQLNKYVFNQFKLLPYINKKEDFVYWCLQNENVVNSSLKGNMKFQEAKKKYKNKELEFVKQQEVKSIQEIFQYRQYNSSIVEYLLNEVKKSEHFQNQDLYFQDYSEEWLLAVFQQLLPERFEQFINNYNKETVNLMRKENIKETNSTNLTLRNVKIQNLMKMIKTSSQLSNLSPNDISNLPFIKKINKFTQQVHMEFYQDAGRKMAQVKKYANKKSDNNQFFEYYDRETLLSVIQHTYGFLIQLKWLEMETKDFNDILKTLSMKWLKLDF